jgi:hypothetical protein
LNNGNYGPVATVTNDVPTRLEWHI